MKKIPHRIERTRNKHSRAVYRDDTIVIRLARNLSRTEEEEHIRSLLRRMTLLALKEHEKRAIDPFRPLLDGYNQATITLADGRTYDISLLPAERTAITQSAEGWMIAIGPGIRRRSLHRLLWKALAMREEENMGRMVRRINEATLRVPVGDVRLAFAQSQWGSCSRRGRIMLNASLLFLPEELLAYVVVHELAHRLHLNHSHAYWRTVERALPDYAEAYRALKAYRLPRL